MEEASDKKDKLIQFSASRINSDDTFFKRYLWKKINWNNRLVVMTGARGVGKTTLLLQYIRENLNETFDEVIYVNIDDLYFSKNALVDFADDFVKKGGDIFFWMKFTNTKTGHRRLNTSMIIFRI